MHCEFVNLLKHTTLTTIQIQEDAEDWAKESAVMGRIYRKSLCTLAAAVGSDCDSGLFTRRDAAEIAASRMLFVEGGNSNRGFILQPSLDHCQYSFSAVLFTRSCDVNVKANCVTIRV